MRILHTSDLHVGRTLGNLSLLEDQAAVLDQIADIASQEKVDVVVIAGDIYDRAVPSAEAVALSRSDGGVLWVQTLPRFEDERRRRDPAIQERRAPLHRMRHQAAIELDQ